MITVERARELFSYDPETGIVTRKITTSSRARKGCTLDARGSQGYLVVRVDGVLYLVHRLIWLIVTGEWPKYEIDHDDRNRQNNRWKNLFDKTSTENQQNRVADGTGVYYAKRDDTWVAEVWSFKKKIYIGQSKDKATAEQLYRTYVAKHLPQKVI